MTQIIRAPRAVLPQGEYPATIVVEGEKIVDILPIDASFSGVDEIILQSDEVLLPGLVDSHVHVNEPGRTPWEGFETATQAALTGGITTIIDMPLNSSPPTTNLQALVNKRESTKGKAYVDIGFWGGAVPGNMSELEGMLEQGVFGFKCFTAHSGIDEYQSLSYEQIRETCTELARLDGLLIVHAEDSETLSRSPQEIGTEYDSYLKSRPKKAENEAINRVIAIAEETGARVHVLHLASAEALPMIAEAKNRGVRLTVETCPHYLTFSAEEIPEGATEFKCAPPLREENNRKALWQGLIDGIIDHIASDHSPCTVDLKNLETGDFGTAWGGVASLQLGFSAIWTAGKEFGITLNDLSRWFGSAPAKAFGIENKGSIAIGNDADFAIVVPEETFQVDVNKLKHRNKVSPYNCRTLRGVVKKTILRGQSVRGDKATGKILSKNSQA